MCCAVLEATFQASLLPQSTPRLDPSGISVTDWWRAKGSEERGVVRTLRWMISRVKASVLVGRNSVCQHSICTRSSTLTLAHTQARCVCGVSSLNAVLILSG